MSILKMIVKADLAVTQMAQNWGDCVIPVKCPQVQDLGCIIPGVDGISVSTPAVVGPDQQPQTEMQGVSCGDRPHKRRKIERTEALAGLMSLDPPSASCSVEYLTKRELQGLTLLVECVNRMIESSDADGHQSSDTADRSPKQMKREKQLMLWAKEFCPSNARASI